MQKGIIGKKVGMTQIFDAKGNVVPVTVVEAGPCVVVQKKTVENDGYAAVQVGYGDLRPVQVNKPMKGHFDKSDVAPKRTLREFRLDDCDSVNVGDIIKADIFAEGDHVDVVGTSKGKGYAGVIKRWNYRRLKETHGTGPVARHSGGQGPITVTGGTASALENYVYTITVDENTSEVVIKTAGTDKDNRIYLASIEVIYE